MSGQTGYYNNMAMCGKAVCTESDIAAYESRKNTPTSLEEQKKTENPGCVYSEVYY